MSDAPIITFVLNDPPYESARSTTAMRLIELALRRGLHVNVFAYEGAVSLGFSKQSPHANAVYGRDIEEDHPNPKDWIGALLDTAALQGTFLDWVNCGPCVDERGVGEAIRGAGRSGPLAHPCPQEQRRGHHRAPARGGGELLRPGTGCQAQDAAGLSFGGREQTRPPQLARDVSRLIDTGVAVHYLQEDARERGIAPQELIASVHPLPRTRQAEFLSAFEQVWKW